MSRIVTAVVTISLSAALSGIHTAHAAPSVDEVIANYIEAIGGEDALKKIENRKTTGTFSVPALGLHAAMTIIVEPPNRLAEVEVEAIGYKMQEGISDGVAWSVDLSKGPTILDEAGKASQARQAVIDTYHEWRRHYSDATVDGEAAVGERSCYKVTFTPALGGSQAIYVDKETGLVLQSEFGTSNAIITSSHEDYKEFDGVLIPTKITQRGGLNGEVVITIDTVEQNIEINKGTFDLPPEIKALQE